MPSFGADMAKGQVSKWLVKPGDVVKKGDIIANIETMKGLIDMEVFDNGVIEHLLAEEGVDIEVGAPIAQLTLNNEEAFSNDAYQPNKHASAASINDASSNQLEPQVSANTVNVEPSETPADTNQNKDEVRLVASPAARKKAEQIGIDWRALAKVKYELHGVQVPLILADVERAMLTDTPINTSTNKPAASVTMSADASDTNTPMRQAIGAAVSRSKREIPHYYLQLDMLLDPANEWLKKYNASVPIAQRMLITALIYCAIARALKAFPNFNGFVVDGIFEAATSVHLGNVINLRKGGLVVAAIHDAQDLNCEQMMEKLKDQVIRAKEGGLRMSEMQDATVSVSNLGERGSDTMQSIIFPPQVAIIGIGRERTVPWVVNNQLGLANIVSLTLAADHRVSDGHSGARLLNKINKLMQDPERLI
jgi:pyruvate dehydrogenase E2 component (dihydrolipoamide acetyltransferase)